MKPFTVRRIAISNKGLSCQKPRFKENFSRGTFLHSIVTGDETWTLTRESKQQSLEWRHYQIPKKKKKAQRWSLYFRDRKKVILIEFMPLRATVNVVSYCETLKKFCIAIENRRRGMLKKRIFRRPQQYSVPDSPWHKSPSHHKFGWDAIFHISYSPDTTFSRTERSIWDEKGRRQVKNRRKQSLDVWKRCWWPDSIAHRNSSVFPPPTGRIRSRTTIQDYLRFTSHCTFFVLWLSNGPFSVNSTCNTRSFDPPDINGDDILEKPRSNGAVKKGSS